MMRDLFKTIAHEGGTTYLVGGAVRDKVMGLKPKDHDYLVCGMTAEALENVLYKFGYPKLVGESFPCFKFKPHGQLDITVDFALPRIEQSTGVGHTDFEITAYGPGVSVEQDLARRDFTINAIAENVLTKQVVDPFNGRKDIADKKLKIVHTWSFMDDPLRILRGIQFAARLGFQPDEEMKLSMCRDAHLIPQGCTAERIAIEICKLLKAPKPSVGFRLLRDTGVLWYVWPELAALVDLKQNPAYHAYDVFEHVIHACDAITGTGKNLIWRRLCAVCHDIGKAVRRQFKNLFDAHGEFANYSIVDDCVVVTRGDFSWDNAIDICSLEEAGQPTFIGHDIAGGDMFEAMFDNMKFASVSEEAVPGVYFPRDKMAKMIRNHMFMCDCESTPKAIRKFIRTVGRENVFDQIRLRIADRSAKGIDARADIEQWMKFARRIRTLSHGQKAPSAFSLKDLVVTGHDVMTHLGMKKPSKLVGTILQGLLDRVVEDPELNVREVLLALATELV